MGKGRELTKNTIILSVGKLCMQAVSFLLLPVYTKLLSAKDYGLIDLLITYTSFLLPIISLQMEQAVFRFLIDARKNEEQIQNIISTAFVMLVSVVGIFAIGYFLVIPRLHIVRPYVLLGMICSSLFSLFTLQIARGLGENIRYSIGVFVRASSNVGCNLVFLLVLHWGINGVFAAHILSAIVCGFYITYKLKLWSRIRICIPDKKTCKCYLNYAFPLIPNQISWWILSLSDRMVISAQLGVYFNGIYAAASKLSNIYSLLYQMFNLAWVEMISVYFHEQKEMEKLRKTIMRILLSVYLLLLAVMPFVFSAMVDTQYAEAYNQIPILLFGAFYSAGIGVVSAYYIADKNTKIIAKTSGICAVLNLILDIFLMPYLGLYAASISSAAVYFIMYWVRMWDARRRYAIKPSKIFMILTISSSALAFYCYYRRVLWLQILCLVGVVIGVGLANHVLIREGVAILREKVKYLRLLRK